MSLPLMPPSEIHIAFLLVPQVTLLDVSGPYEVFTQANAILGNRESASYILHSLSSSSKRTITSDAGLRLVCDGDIRHIDFAIDTLFICGIPNSLDSMPGEKIYQWIREIAPKVRRICSICTGSFFLAKAGLLDGKQATTHWELCRKLQKDFPRILVKEDPIFLKDGNIYTSAGISSGMDLALALVEEDHGRQVALSTAQQMVLYLKRPGNQSQFSSVIRHQYSDYRPIQEIESWITDNIHTPMTVETLAGQAQMSPRNFARVFLRETGITPAKYVEKIRVETACRYLTETQFSLKEIASRCGMTTLDNMRRLFLKHLQVTPSTYRGNFKLS